MSGILIAQNAPTEVTQKKIEPAVHYGFVVDNSGSFRLLLEASIAFIKGTVAHNGSGDKTFLVRFSGSDRIVLEQELSEDATEIGDAADAMYSEAGQKAIIDAVMFSAKYLVENDGDDFEGSRALILITDGDERSSITKLETAVAFLKLHQIRVYSVGIADGTKVDLKLLERLARETNGWVISLKNQTELRSAASEVAAAIRKP